VMVKRRRRCRQLLDDRKETETYRKFKEEALDRTVCRTHLGRRMDVVMQSTE